MKGKHIRRRALISVIALVILSTIIYGRVEAPQRPNVIIILIDCLRKDHVSLYGYLRRTTPHIDDFAQDAIIVQNAVSQCSWTSPSVASLFSSLYPSTHGCISYSEEGEAIEADYLHPQIDTLAEMLKKRGYRTAAFVANRWVSERLKFDQGFDVFDPVTPKKVPNASELNEPALKWITENKDVPFFVYLHYMDPHGPYSPPPPFDTFFKSLEVRKLSGAERKTLGRLAVGKNMDEDNLNFYIDRYDGEIRYADYHIGKVLTALEELGVVDNSIIIVTADHGEAFFEHSVCSHGHSLYSEEIDIPLIIKPPQSMELPDIRDARVELIDVTATLFHALDCAPRYGIDGQNLQDESNQEYLRERPLFSEELSSNLKGPPKVAMINDNYKAIYMLKRKEVTELYDLSQDKAERENIVNENHDRVEGFEAEIKSWLESKAQKREELGLSEGKVTVDDEKRKDQLKSLGYIQ